MNISYGVKYAILRDYELLRRAEVQMKLEKCRSHFSL